jgi:hypothetical protein
MLGEAGKLKVPIPEVFVPDAGDIVGLDVVGAVIYIILL